MSSDGTLKKTDEIFDLPSLKVYLEKMSVGFFDGLFGATTPTEKMAWSIND